ncbi:hypothetical protein BD626DRAFT_99152 [Schizophyllum amplum]|uniref:Secreted protein n=1 Tax=Schizophyllum amplum TaxID=97359 RepID=A0A550CRE4_9AGAR|nr:hypothetical protein BD626DRAFT_99152 [Auriculariopsis ampla]
MTSKPLLAPLLPLRLTVSALVTLSTPSLDRLPSFCRLLPLSPSPSLSPQGKSSSLQRPSASPVGNVGPQSSRMVDAMSSMEVSSRSPRGTSTRALLEGRQDSTRTLPEDCIIASET